MHIKMKVPSQQFNSTSGKHYKNMLKKLYKFLAMWTFVISIDLLFDKLDIFTPIIPVCHNEGFKMHNDIHHITITMMNNYILFIYFWKLLFSFQYIDIMYSLLSSWLFQWPNGRIIW